MGVHLLFLYRFLAFEENLPTIPHIEDVLRKSFLRFEEKWLFLRKSFRF